MSAAIERPGDTAVWHAAVRGEAVDWAALLAGYAAAIDWPACEFWRQLSAANPEAIVLLSTRESAETWWESMEQTIVATLTLPMPADDLDWVERRAMTLELMDRFEPGWRDREAAIAAYERHNAAVRSEVPAKRLIEWTPGDGWDPICGALDLPVPAEPFPHTNTSADFRASQEVEERS